MENSIVEDTARQGLGWFRGSVVALLAAVALCLLGTWAVRSAAAPPAWTPPPASPNVEVLSGQLGRDIYGLYLVDRANGTICVYQYVPRERKLKLTAVRRYTFDVQLDETKRKELDKRER